MEEIQDSGNRGVILWVSNEKIRLGNFNKGENDKVKRNGLRSLQIKNQQRVKESNQQ